MIYLYLACVMSFTVLAMNAMKDDGIPTWELRCLGGTMSLFIIGKTVLFIREVCILQ